MPSEPTRRISIGSTAKSVGLAGEAMCRIASKRSARAGWWTGSPSVTSASTSVKRGLSTRWATFSFEPVTKLSTTTTVQPRPISESTRCEGTKPAPPETSTR